MPALPKLQMLSQWPRALWQNPLLFLMASVLGGAAVFTYSYEPLHRSKDWKIDYLEQRLRTRNAQVEDLRAELQGSTRALGQMPSSEEISALREQFAEVERLADSQKGEIDTLTENLRRSRSSRNTWRTRHAKLIAEIELSAATPEPPELAKAPAPPDPAEVVAQEPSPTATEAETGVSEQPAVSPASPAPSMPSEPGAVKAPQSVVPVE